MRDFHSCKQEEGQSVSSYVLKMKGYINNLEHLGHLNYNMYSMRKTVNEFHVMLKLHEKTLPKNNAPTLNDIRAGKVQKGNKHKKSQSQMAARGQNHRKEKNKQAYAPKPKIPSPPKREDPVKDAICHECASGAGGSGIFVIELNTILNRSWIYDTSCGTHICNTTQGLRASRKLKPGALSLYVGNGQREVVEAIGAIYLCLPSGLEIVLNNCHYTPSITRGVNSVSRLYEDGFVNRLVNNTIKVSRNNMVYFSAIPRDGIFEIDLFNSLTNESSIYAVSNKRAKLNLDSDLLWHCRLGHTSKKCIEKLQHDGLLDSSDLRAFEKCVSCMSGKMARKPYTHQVERAKDLLGQIHTDVCGPFKIMGEYMSQEFLDHLKDHGIIAHRTPPYTPQHNGVLERRNRTLLDMVRSIISQTTLPKSFWDYALETTTRILNMVPTQKAEKTPYEVWHGKAPKLSYLKVWGCEALVKRDTLTKPDELESDLLSNAEFLENSLINQEASGSLEDLEIIQEEDTHPSIDTSLNHEVDDNEVWVLVKLPPNGKTVGSKWLFKKKTDIDGNVQTYKAHLVAKVYTQTPRIDYEETFSPVADIRAIRILIAIAAYYDYEICVKSYLGRCFAVKDLGEAAYILGIKIYRDRSRRLIGLCQSAYIEKILKRYCMENSKRRSIPMQEKLKLSKSQGASTPAELKRMQNVLYASAVGSIMYVMRCTRPDVAFAQNVTSQFQQNPGDIQWTTVKNILKYLKNTKDMFLVYRGDLKQELRVFCYTDAGYLTDADDLKS
nr:hypothetical protein [Tanacetum cinerariifolium]